MIRTWVGSRVVLANVGLLAGLLAVPAQAAQSMSGSSSSGAQAPATRAPAPLGVPHSERAQTYILRRWGIDMISVRSVSSGAALEFRYRVVDPTKAAVLNDAKATPQLRHQKSGLRLSVPQMENVGSLRQVAPPEAGKEYWMIFQDPRRLVKRGDHVDISVGVLRLYGLPVE